MFKTNYYCLVAGFQDIILDSKKIPFTSDELKSYLSEFLDKKDFLLVEALYLTIDNKNVLNKILKNDAAFLPNGKYSEEKINEEIKAVSYTHLTLPTKRIV